MFNTLQSSGAQLKFTRDQLSWFHGLFATNHKKTILIDDQICYMGGINLCDHNFFWHDLMFRFADSGICQFFKKDFLQTWKNWPHPNLQLLTIIPFFCSTESTMKNASNIFSN